MSCRDFVTLRHWKVSEDQEVILSCGVAVTHPAMPPCSQHVRSVNIHSTANEFTCFNVISFFERFECKCRAHAQF